MIKFVNKPRNIEVGPTSSYMGRGKGTKICTYCHKPGHRIDVCFKKHGFPTYLRKTNLTQASTSEDTNEDTVAQNKEDSNATPPSL